MLDLKFLLDKNRGNLEGLKQPVKAYAEQLIINCWLRGVYIKIIQGYRSIAYQDELYTHGRRGIPGEKIVTNARGGSSFHNYGYAIDFALLMPDGKNVSWDMKLDLNKNGVRDWDEVVAEAKKLGFKWGGDFKNFKDYPHLEMTFGKTIAQMRAGSLPKEYTVAVKYPTNFTQSPSTNTPILSLLRKGDRGAVVTDLQTNLVRLGYTLTVDGIFGEKTDIAVRNLQGNNGLKVDGIVGKDTQAKIKELRNKQTETKSEEPKPTIPVITLKEVLALMANCGLQEWEVKNGVDGLNTLVRLGIINTPDSWKDKLDQPVPTWLLFSLLGRILDKGK